jgi:ferredoxin
MPRTRCAAFGVCALRSFDFFFPSSQSGKEKAPDGDIRPGLFRLSGGCG